MDEEGGELEGLRLRPGLAMSQDGRNWARIEAEHHTGALFDVGEEGEWDEMFIGGPQVGCRAGPGQGWGEGGAGGGRERGLLQLLAWVYVGWLVNGMLQ